MPTTLKNCSSTQSTNQRLVALNNNPIFEKYVNYMSDRHIDNKYKNIKRNIEENCFNINGCSTDDKINHTIQNCDNISPVMNRTYRSEAYIIQR